MTEQRKPSPAELRQRARLAARRARERFARARRAERNYAKLLRQVARQVGAIVRGFAPEGRGRGLQQARMALERYAEALRPWAEAVGERMVAEVDRRELDAWRSRSEEMGELLHSELRKHAVVGGALRESLARQVELITSLPTEAAQRVHRLTLRSLEGGERAAEVAKEILRTGHVTESRAKLIARTEVGRTVTELTQARATAVGVEQYIWRTSGDGDVRPLHKKLNGKVFRWDDPPIAGENGERAHAGAIYNCRCWAEPVV